MSQFTSTYSDAATLLQLSGSPSRDEVQAAWKKRAFEIHPDRGKGTEAEFVALSAAYRQLLASFDPQESEPHPAIRPRRPVTTTCRKQIDDTVQELCRDYLDELGVPGHVASRSERSGRRITFYVDGQICAGINRVAVSVADLVNRRKPKITVFEFVAENPGGGTVDVPEEEIETVFPGAREVRFEFEPEAG